MELKSYRFKAHIKGCVNARSDSDAVARIRGLAGMYQDRGEWIEIEEVDTPEVIEDVQLEQQGAAGRCGGRPVHNGSNRPGSSSCCNGRSPEC